MNPPEETTPEQRDRLLDELRGSIEEGQTERLYQMLTQVAPADLADLLEDLGTEEKQAVLAALSSETAGQVLSEMSREGLRDIAGADLGTLTNAVETMEPDEAVDLLEAVGEEAAESILAELPARDAATAEQLLAYGPDTAGGIMTPEFVLLARNITAAEAVTITQQSRESETIAHLFVADENNCLIGHLPLHRLVFASPQRRLEELMETDMVTVYPDTDQEDVVRMATRYDLDAVPVVDEGHHLLGVITADDILEAAREEVDEDMYALAGTVEIDPLHSTVRRSTVLRLPWLLLSLVDGLFIAFLAGYFDRALNEVAHVALFIPLIPLMGGNVAVQSSTIMVRALAVGDMTRRSILNFVARQVFVTVALAVCCGVLAGLLAGTLVASRPDFMIVVGLAVLISILVAGSLGIGVPFAFERIGIDPAISAGPFGTMLNDALCIVIYLSLATLLV